MEKDYLNEYRKEIRKRYELEKKDGNHANFLVNPSPANLRELCVNIFRDNKNTDDFVSFQYYFGFDYTIENVNELNLQKNLNKFVPIGRFLKGESELKSIHGLDLVAMLVNFKNRPFNKFKKLNLDEVKFEEESHNLSLLQSEKLKENCDEKDEDLSSKSSMMAGFIDANAVGNGQKNRRDKLKYLFIGFFVLGVGFFGINSFFKKKKCMQWQKDHYELVDCDAVKGENYDFGAIVPVDQSQVNLKKLNVCDTTSFFIGVKPRYYYCKINDQIECFNQRGYHPLSEQELRRITPHIVNTYIKKTKNSSQINFNN